MSVFSMYYFTLHEKRVNRKYVPVDMFLVYPDFAQRGSKAATLHNLIVRAGGNGTGNGMGRGSLIGSLLLFTLKVLTWLHRSNKLVHCPTLSSAE